MNTRCYLELEEIQSITFRELPEDIEKLFRGYIEESRHLQEISQLYKMMLFNLDGIMVHFQLNFNDTIISRKAETISMIQLNALIGNAISSARTLIESMELYDKVYISDEKIFKTNYISCAYDNNFSYRFVDFLRNYMQHGHVPVSFDGQRIYFQISEILDVSHMKINSKLRESLAEFESELMEYGEIESRMTVVPTLYHYFLIVHTLVQEFFILVKNYRMSHFQKIKEILINHPEYVSDLDGQKYVGVYLDEVRGLHGFFAEDNIEKEIEQWIEAAKVRVEQYRKNNGDIFSLKVKYCLENRMPAIRFVGDDNLSKNLAQLCMESGTDIRHLSFSDYYGKATMHSVYRLYPYIQYEDGVRWNVPYEKVTLGDFLRTFPDVKEKGITVYANNVGGADDLFQSIMQNWAGYIEQAKSCLNSLGIYTVADVLDGAERINFIWKYVKKIRNSFAVSIKNKPDINQLKRYISKKNQWNITELAKNLHADKDLLCLVLQEMGFVYKATGYYVFDKKVAEKLDAERQQYMAKLYDAHGSDVNCVSMNQEVEQANVNILYLAVLYMEQGGLEEFDTEVEKIIRPLKQNEQYLYWDGISRSLRFKDELPKAFSQENEFDIWTQITEVNKKLEKVIKDIEE